MIIEFSGGDGSGKTTAMGVFCDRLEANGKRVLRTREVGSPHIPLCEELRKLILSPEADMSGEAMEFVFAAMRIENEKFYRSVENDYDFIVSDRGWLCHLAYTDHNVSKSFTERFYLDLVAYSTYLPDLIYYFDVDPEVSAKRRAVRGEPVDAIEAKGQDFQRRVIRSYRSYVDYFKRQVAINTVNANVGLEDVTCKMKQAADALSGR